MLTLYAHPFSSYCWKPLIALYERGIAFDYANLDDPAQGAELAWLWPVGKMPLLVDGDRLVPESTIIVEHLDLTRPGAPPMIPIDRLQALEVRKLDRLSDNYLMGPMQAIVADRLRDEAKRDPEAVEGHHAMLVKALDWWEAHVAARDAAGKDWAADDFGLADCATAPALFYVDWIHPFAESHPKLHAYRARLLARPSVARVVDEARPFRNYFPFSDPGRD